MTRDGSMKLFSWFIRNETISTERNTVETSSKKGRIENNSMWPTAEVRSRYLLEQQKYIDARKTLSNSPKQQPLNYQHKDA